MATEAKASGKREGFDYSKMREDLVNAEISRRKVAIPTGSKFPNKVGLLQIEIRNTTSPGDLGECDECSAASSLDDEFCPFCGVGQDGAKAPPPAPSQKIVKVARGLKRKDAPEPSVEVIDVVPEKTKPAQVVEPTEADLNRRVKDIIALKVGAEASAWLLGRKIQELFDLKLWRARPHSEKDGPAYRSFNQFVAEEIDISGQHAYRLMDVAKSFSEEQVKRIGSTKLLQVLRLDEGDRAKLVHDIQKDELSVSEVRKLVDAKDPKRRDTGRAQTPPGQPGHNAHEPKFPTGSLATAFSKASVDVQSYAKPTGWEKDSAYPPDEARKAHTLEDVPFAVVDLLNDVRLQITALVAPTGIVFKVEVTKVDPIG